MDLHQRNDLLKMDAQKMYVSMLHDCRSHLTLLQTGCRGFPRLVPGTLCHHSVPGERSMEGRRADHTRGNSSPDRAGCGRVPSQCPALTSHEEACILDGRHHDHGCACPRNDARDCGEDARGQTGICIAGGLACAPAASLGGVRLVHGRQSGPFLVSERGPGPPAEFSPRSIDVHPSSSGDAFAHPARFTLLFMFSFIHCLPPWIFIT
jgi:hypothetical protein